MHRRPYFLYSFALLSTLALSNVSGAQVFVGDRSVPCAEDAACFNRLHPDIPMVATANPGERIVFAGRDAFDLTLEPDKLSSAPAIPREGTGIVHALTGPVFIKGAVAGDVLTLTMTSQNHPPLVRMYSSILIDAGR